MFEIKVVYQCQTGEDKPGLVKETYVASGLTSADVQNQVIENIAPYVFGYLEVPSIRKRTFFEIVKDDNAENFYEAKVAQITYDGDVEKRREVLMLVQANNVIGAAHALDEHLKSHDCEVVSIVKSPVVEVLYASTESNE